jgi:hypothetical protein
MGLLKPDVRHRRPDGREDLTDAPAITIHALAQARAAVDVAVERGLRPVLLSAPAAAQSLGVGWFAGLVEILAERHPGLDPLVILDCGDAAGTAQGALRRGFRTLVFQGNPDAARRLAALGATILTERPPALDLGGENRDEALTRACRSHLQAFIAKTPAL